MAFTWLILALTLVCVIVFHPDYLRILRGELQPWNRFGIFGSPHWLPSEPCGFGLVLTLEVESKHPGSKVTPKSKLPAIRKKVTSKNFQGPFYGNKGEVMLLCLFHLLTVLSFLCLFTEPRLEVLVFELFFFQSFLPPRNLEAPFSITNLWKRICVKIPL